ncbi:unnamed protein product [Clavelina lepadiformis]|uniref:acylphosphatase n=1 Tax=Clavelina lepadiformis TaxID=159417 RepID=A0ABP0FS68_CLALP
MGKRVYTNLIISCLCRFPFWEALSLMMLFGELESKKGKKLDVPLYLVYLDAVALILLGTFMSFNTSMKRASASLSVVHMTLHALLELHHHDLNLHVMFHILLRNIGVIASYLLIAAGVGDEKAKRSSVIQMSYFVFGVLFAGQAYLLATNKLEKKILKYLLPRNIKPDLTMAFIAPVFSMCLLLTSFCFATQRHGVKQARRFAAIYWLLIAFPTDLTMARSVYFEVTGRVQGVFFRKHTKKTCDKYDVCGWVLNTSHGSVQGLLEGTEVSVDKVKNWLQKVGSPKSRIDKCSFLKETTIDTKTSSTFNIIRDKQEVKRKTFEM